MRWLGLAAVVLFLGTLFWFIQAKDPDFYYSAHDLYRQAQEALERREPVKALDWGRRALAQEPSNDGYATFVGWRYLDTGQPQAARKIFSEVLTRQPQSREALMGLAQAWENLGQPAAARETLDTYLTAHPEDTVILRFVAGLASRHRSQRAPAVDYYRRLYALNPQDGEVRRQLLDLLVAGGQYGEAIPLQEAELAEAPDNPELLHQLALLYSWQRDYDAAGPIYQRLLDKEAENLALRREAAQVAEAAQDVDQALTHYLRLYAADGAKKEYALPLARLWSQKGRHGEAAAVLAPLTEAEADLGLRRWYALELLLTQDYGAARRAYHEVWEAGDTHKETIINLARLHAQQRHFAPAAGFWDEARRRQLLTPELRWEAALTYSYAHRYGDAVAVMSRADRQDPRTLLFLGQMHAYQNHGGQAAHYYRAYLEKRPDDVEVRQELARLLALEEDTRPQALDQFQEILKRRDEPRVRLQRAAALMQEAQELAVAPDAARRSRAPAALAQAEAELRQCPPSPEDPQAILEQARLFLWLGDLETSLARYDQFLAAPGTMEALALDKVQLERVRVLIYLQRAAEAQDILRRLRAGRPGAWGSPAYLKQPEVRELLMASVEADLAGGDIPGALRGALWLYGAALPPAQPLPVDWTALLAATPVEQQVAQGKALTPEERLWIVRALCRQANLPQHQEILRLAVDLMVENLRGRRSDRLTARQHQATLLLLAHLVPQLTHFNDLQELMYRLPGIRTESPEYVATLSFFTGRQGRQGGKLDYLLQHLKEQQRQHRPRLPGDLVHLAHLALQLGESRTAARYLTQALELRPQDKGLAALRLQVLASRRDYDEMLQTLDDGPATPDKALQMAQLYLQRHQYEAAAAILADVPPGDPAQPDALLLLAQAYRGQGSYDQALQTINQLADRGPLGDQALMLKAQVLEALPDRVQAQTTYEAIIHQAPESQAARVAQARLARSRGQWAGAQRHFVAALHSAPQDVELLNELEQVRAQMRPWLAARSLRGGRGERNPEEGRRPWQFGRYDREALGGGRNALAGANLPWALFPETNIFRDSNKLRGFDARLGGGAWIGKSMPASLAVDYRQYRQSQSQLLHTEASPERVLTISNASRSRLDRLGVTAGAGPLPIWDYFSLSAELTWRHYWKKVEQKTVFQGFEQTTPIFIGQTATLRQYQVPQVTITGPPNARQAALTMVTLTEPITATTATQFTSTRSLNAILEATQRQEWDRLLGSLNLAFTPTAATHLNLTYSRQDIFDQDPAIYPRLYQSVLDLERIGIVTLNQGSLSASHQFRPDLEWQGTVTGALFSDANRRLTLYQGLNWQAVNQPRMHLQLTPHYYLAAYRRTQDTYFSPQSYHALGVGLSFDRQIFRLPTLILQGTTQLVGNEGRWGPALQGLVGLEQELVHNFYWGLHVFYFREWVDNYRLLNASLGFRWHF